MHPGRTRTLRTFGRRGPLIALGVAAAMLVAIAVPASAQFFPFGRGYPAPPPPPPRGIPQQPGGPFGGGGFPFFNGYEQPRPPQIDYSHAPRPEKTDNIPERYV